MAYSRSIVRLPAGVNRIFETISTLIDMVLRFSFITKPAMEGGGFENYKFVDYFYRVLSTNAIAARVVHAEVLEDNSELFRTIRSYLQHYEAVNAELCINPDGLHIHLPNEQFWECNNCRAVHMFHADGQCRTIKHRQQCRGSLVERPIAELNSSSNYYRQFLSEGRHKYPIRCRDNWCTNHQNRDRQLAFRQVFGRAG